MPTPEDRQRFINAVMKRSDRHARQALQWAGNAARAADRIVTAGRLSTIEEVAFFWLRLHGVMTELTEAYEVVESLVDGHPEAASHTAILARAVLASCRAVRAALDEDETIYAQYRRDTDCHVWQESYELSVKGERLKERRRFAVLGKEFTVDEIEERVRKLFDRHSRDELAIAVDLAKRLQPRLHDVHDALQALE